MVNISMLRSICALLACTVLGSANAADVEPGDLGEMEPIPSYYQDGGGSDTRSYVQDNFNEKVDPFTGKLQIHVTDFSIPGPGGMTLNVQRSYNSLNEKKSDPTPNGMGWTMHFGRVLRRSLIGICTTSNESASNMPVLELPDGGRQIFFVALGGSYFITTTNWKAECAPGGTGLIVYSPDGTRYEMVERGVTIGMDNAAQASYYPNKIIDKHGNSITISYNREKLYLAINSVTTSDGRSLTFEYQGTSTGSPLLKSITDGTRKVSYEYEVAQSGLHTYLLTKVIWPEGKAWNYEYNMTQPVWPGQGFPGSWSMKKIIYPDGGSFEYTYGFVDFGLFTSVPISTVVIQKRGNSGNLSTILSDGNSSTWNYSYTPSTTAYDGSEVRSNELEFNPMFDKTVVQGPDGIFRYHHFGFRSCRDLSYLYLMGTLIESRFDSNDWFLTESSSWEPRLISHTHLERPGDSWPGGAYTFTYAARLKKHSIARGGLVDGIIQGTLAETFYKDPDEYGNPGTIMETGSSSMRTDTRTTVLSYFNDPARWIIGIPQNEAIQDVGSITRDLDIVGRARSENRFGVTTGFTYNENTGDLASVTDARGKSVLYSNYRRGIAQREDHPEGVVVQRTVDDGGNILSQIDGEGNATSYEYDELDRVKKITPPRGLTINVNWSAPAPGGAIGETGRLVTYGTSSEFTWHDGFDRPIKVRSSDTARGETLEQTVLYDPSGRRVFLSYPNSAKGLGLKYGLGKKPIEFMHNYDPATASFDASRKVEDLGQQINVTNERGNWLAYVYRHYGNHAERDLLQVKTQFLNTDMAIERNGAGQPLSITQDGVTRTFTYDTRYFMTSSTDPETGLTEYGRDAVGNMISKKIGGIPVAAYEYDDLNRLKFLNYADNSPDVTRTYYKNNLLKMVKTNSVRWDYRYNANKDITNETLALDGKEFSTDYEYNNMNALKTMTYESGRVVSYTPDAWGRATTALPYVTGITRHPTGQIESMTFANGVKTAVGLNSRLWPSTLKIDKGGNAFVNSAYLYDPVGNLSKVTDSVDSSFNRSMDYDHIDRLTTANGPWGQGSFSYDGRGNIRTQEYGFGKINHIYESGTERLKSMTGVVNKIFSYDRHGNVIHNGARNFLYNEADQMICANCGKADQINYGYDGAGGRVKVEDLLGTTYFIRGMGGKLLVEMPPNGRIKEYIYLDGKQVATREE